MTINAATSKTGVTFIMLYLMSSIFFQTQRIRDVCTSGLSGMDHAPDEYLDK